MRRLGQVVGAYRWGFSGQRGAGSVEYLGGVLIVGAVMAALLVTGSCTASRSPPVPDLGPLRALVAPPKPAPRVTPPRPRRARTSPAKPRPARRTPPRPEVEVPRWVAGR